MNAVTEKGLNITSHIYITSHTKHNKPYVSNRFQEKMLLFWRIILKNKMKYILKYAGRNQTENKKSSKNCRIDINFYNFYSTSKSQKNFIEKTAEKYLKNLSKSHSFFNRYSLNFKHCTASINPFLIKPHVVTINAHFFKADSHYFDNILPHAVMQKYHYHFFFYEYERKTEKL